MTLAVRFHIVYPGSAGLARGRLCTGGLCVAL